MRAGRVLPALAAALAAAASASVLLVTVAGAGSMPDGARGHMAQGPPQKVHRAPHHAATPAGAADKDDAGPAGAKHHGPDAIVKAEAGPQLESVERAEQASIPLRTSESAGPPAPATVRVVLPVPAPAATPVATRRVTPPAPGPVSRPGAATGVVSGTGSAGPPPGGATSPPAPASTTPPPVVGPGLPTGPPSLLLTPSGGSWIPLAVVLVLLPCALLAVVLSSRRRRMNGEPRDPGDGL